MVQMKFAGAPPFFIALGVALSISCAACQLQARRADGAPQDARAQPSQSDAVPVLPVPQAAVPTHGATTPNAAPELLATARFAPDFATLAERVMPAVVSIQTEQHVRLSPGGMQNDPFNFFHHFGQQIPREYENRGLGSGFVIEAAGLILTNQHVIDKADTIQVTFATADGSERQLTAKVVGEAPEYDVALLKTDQDAQATHIMTLGDSAASRIGDWVMAVGNPFGLDHSVSVGIISAKDRRDVAPSGRKGFYDFLQTDASINPGNSGGPLINLHGEVIGINAAINAQGQGIGFAIPINMVKEMLPQLKEHGRFTRSWLGVQVQALTPELAESFGLSAPRGALVAQVVPDGPAQAAGLQPGDIVLEFNGKKLNRVIDLQLFASITAAGKKVPVLIVRDGKEKTLTVTLAAVSEPNSGPSQRPGGLDSGPRSAAANLGLTIAEISPGLRQQLGYQEPGGAIVQAVQPGGLAHKAGLMRGDIIGAVGNKPVKSAQAFADLLQSSRSGSVLRLRVWRQGVSTFVALKKP
jgi:serine protease Do